MDNSTSASTNGYARHPGTVPADDDWSEARFAEAIVIDGLAGIDDLERPLPEGPLPEPFVRVLRESGVTAINMSVGGLGTERFDAAVADIARNDRVIAANPELLTKGRSAGDIRRAKADGKVAVLYGFQDSGMIGDRLDRIGTFASMGVRFMQLTYNARTLWGDGAAEPGDAGLSRLGRQAIECIEAERVLVDLSHCGQRTLVEALDLAKRPPVITHTGCRALFDHPRNVDDSSLRTVAQKGGVVGIYWAPFLQKGGDATPEAVVRHMQRAVDLCGEDHVSVGSDGQITPIVLDEGALAQQHRTQASRVRAGLAARDEQVGLLVTVPEWNTPQRFRLLSQALDRAGWRTGRIEKVLGGNLLRLGAEVWGD